MMSKDKYANIFSPQMKAIVFIILQIFFVTHVVFKSGEYNSDIPQFLPGNIQSRDAFRSTAQAKIFHGL